MPLILVVDDEPAIREVLQNLLEDAGYAVSTAADGQDALDQIAADPPDLLITDIRMPRLDGWSLLARVRGQHPQLPVIVLSAVSRSAPGHQAVVIAKPFAADPFLALIARLLVG